MIISMEKDKGDFQILNGVSILRMFLKHQNRNLKEVAMSLEKALFLFASTKVFLQIEYDI